MRLLKFTCIILILIHGCAAPTRDTSQTLTTQEEQAEAYLSSGNYNAAAEEYLSLADKNKKLSERYLLKAAGAYLMGGQTGIAQSTLEQIQNDKLDNIQLAEKNILLSKIALSNNDALLAINKLDFELPDASPDHVRAAFYTARAEAMQMDQQFTNALHARIQLDQYINDPALSESNKQEIWKLLTHLNINELEEVQATVTSNINFAGWIELAIISKSNLYDQEMLEFSIASWSQRYPNHPAQGMLVQEILELARQANTQPKQIALLLPSNTQYREISNAIREGFLSAWYETPGQKPILKIYNYDNQNIVDVYNNAVTDGAEFIVGPLEKEIITTLVDTGNISVKTLVLNQININEPSVTATPSHTTNTADFFQFGLLPEDEARQAAERAWSDGHANALVITPDTTWGERIYTAFTTRWNELGGIIVEHVRMPAGIQDFSTPVKQLLNIDNSEQRAKELVATLHRKVFSEPRYRRDADIIFLASTPLMGRQIIPQLRYYQANDIVTYSISNINSGTFDPEANSDINGVIFSDMPWMLDPGQEYSLLQQTLNKTWNQNESSVRRFYAFGIDSYRLIAELGRLISQKTTFTGTTGKLRVTEEGHIQRTSVWAKFVNGAPELMETN